MLKFKMFVAATICSLPLLATAGITYEAGDQTLETRLCMSAAQDAPITFYKKHKDSGKSLHYISKNILCNDMSIANFAVLAGNKSNAKRLSRFKVTRGHTEINELVNVVHEENHDTNKIVKIYGC